MTRRAVPLLSVELTASEAVIEQRIASQQRQQFRKLTDLALYRRSRATGTFTTPVIPRTDLRIDTGASAPAATARQIAAFLPPG